MSDEDITETIGTRIAKKSRANGNKLTLLSIAGQNFDLFLDEIRYELVNYKTTRKFLGWLELKLELTERDKEKLRYKKQLRDQEKENE